MGRAADPIPLILGMYGAEVLQPLAARNQEKPPQTSHQKPLAHKQGTGNEADSPGDDSDDAAAPAVTAVDISSSSALPWTKAMLGALQAALAVKLKQYHHASLAEDEAALADLPAVARLVPACNALWLIKLSQP